MDMNEIKNSSWTNIVNPIFQVVIALGANLLINFGALALQWTGLVVMEERFPYLTAASLLLCFAMFNAVISLSAPNPLVYWGRSIYCFLGLAFVSVSLASLLSGLRLSEAGSYWWILIVVTFGYLVFLALVNTMRNIVNFAQREEWNQPRFRQSKKK
jgi:hypothetical protein